MENSGIHWLDNGHTQNFWEGCTQISPGCDNCYAKAGAERFGRVAWNGKPRRTSAALWKNPRKWNREAQRDVVRIKVFANSIADFFDNQAEETWRREAWDIIRECTNLDWLILTKRPQNIRKMLPPDWDDGWPHVWLGVSTENQSEADRRIPILLEIPAKLYWLSAEPLLEAIDLKPHLPKVDWVIAGGESHGGWRPMNDAWAQQVLDDCQAVGVPFFMKQMAAFRPTDDMIPADLLIREYPISRAKPLTTKGTAPAIPEAPTTPESPKGADEAEPAEFEPFKSERDGNHPTIEELIAEGQADYGKEAEYINRRSKEHFMWELRLSERCWIAYDHHGLRGKRSPVNAGNNLEDFAKKQGVSYDVATGIIGFYPYRERALRKQVDDEQIAITQGKRYKWKSWRTCLKWYKAKDEPEGAEDAEGDKPETVADDLAAKLFAEQSKLKASRDREFELSGQLAEAQARIAELEAELATYRNPEHPNDPPKGGEKATKPVKDASSDEAQATVEKGAGTTSEARSILDELPNLSLGQVTPVEAESCRPQVEEGIAKYGLHKLVGNVEAVAHAGLYRMRLYDRISEMASVSGAEITEEAQEAIDAAKRIRAASWWIEHGPKSSTDILIEAAVWAAKRNAAKNSDR